MISFMEQPGGIKNVHYLGLNRLEWLFVFELIGLALIVLIFVRAYMISRESHE